MVLVMGVVNVTPDSFSDGGRYVGTDLAVAHGLALWAAGADILDIGGEATNPRAQPTDGPTELARILPVIERLVAAGARVSVDTTKAAVARAAVAAGASIVNDVSGGLFDADMPGVLIDTGAEYIAGHLRGRSIAEVFAREPPAPGNGGPPGNGGLDAITWQVVAAELNERLAVLAPEVRARAWVDPGLGFGKGADPATNLALVEHAGDIGRATGCRVVIGPSRKRFLAAVLGEDHTLMAQVRPDARGPRPEARPRHDAPAELDLDAATVGACLAGVRSGARMLRVHNVTLLRAALALYTRISAPLL